MGSSSAPVADFTAAEDIATRITPGPQVKDLPDNRNRGHSTYTQLSESITPSRCVRGRPRLCGRGTRFSVGVAHGHADLFLAWTNPDPDTHALAVASCLTLVSSRS